MRPRGESRLALMSDRQKRMPKNDTSHYALVLLLRYSDFDQAVAGVGSMEAAAGVVS
jgi:hypothetical protein